MFRLVTSNDAERLADLLGEQVGGARADPLTPALVLVPQAGLRRWLQVHLAERLGVVANVDFRAPAEFAWDLLRAAQPDLPRRSPYDPEVLRWHLHALLGEPLDGAAMAPVREYLQSDGGPSRRYALAGELAHVFERMQGYRRAKLLRWERHEANRNADPRDWQAKLWRRLIARTGGTSRAARVEQWLRSFDPGYPSGAVVGKPAPPGLPGRLACFACANVSPDVLRMLAVAGLHCDIDFYLPLPSREYLGDLPRSRQEVRERLAEGSGENPLVLSMATASRESLELLYDYGCVQPDAESEQFDDAIARDSLLGRVRDDILAHRAAREDDRVALPDESLQFHACHTELREVQTLHDRLLALFAADPTLKPREIAVMMPDVAAYRPAIEAVFGSAPDHDPRFIPYNLGDLAADAAHPAARLFLSLLDAPTARWRLSEILDVLAVPGVMRRLDLDASELALLSRQLKEAGVRWGEDEHARAQVGGYREFSFAFGLDRLLAGFACGDDCEALVAGVAPLAGIEGAAFARIDALLAVLDGWKRLREFASREMDAVEWQRALNGLFDGLYAGDPGDIAEARALERMRGALQDLVEHTRAAQLQQPLAWHDLRAFLRERMEDADPRQQLFSGGVTFCGMVPLRVVPFRVICLLGMDEAAFPRRDPAGLDPLSADRRSGHAERGDRSVREDDRLLFLQLIAAAREALYISWIGRDAHSNETLAPSVVVAELMDVLREDYLAQDKDSRTSSDALLPRVQPLHPFDASLFDARAPRSYGNEWLAAANPPDAQAAAPFMPGAPLPQSGAAQAMALTLDELRRFLLDPARGLLEHGLGLALPGEAHADADDEPLSPGDGLTRWSLTRALLDFGEGNASGDRDLLRARGQLPPGALGDEALRDANVQADALRAAVLAFTGGAAPSPADTLRVDWDDGIRLEGAPTDPYPAGVLHVRPGEIDGRHVLRAWLDALLCSAGGTDKPVMLVGLGEQAVCSFALPQLTPEAARGELRSLIELHRAGRRAPLPFFVRASWKHALACAKAEKKSGAPLEQVDIAVFDKAAKQAEDDSGFGGFDELGQDTVCMAWRGRDLPGPADGELAQDLHRLALAVFARPARAWVEQFP